MSLPRTKPSLRLVHGPTSRRRSPSGLRSIGQILTENHGLAPSMLTNALAAQTGRSAKIGDILVSQAAVTAPTLLTALAEQAGVQAVDLNKDPPDSSLWADHDIGFLLEHQIVPWRQHGCVTIYAVPDANRMQVVRTALQSKTQDARFVIADKRQIVRALSHLGAAHYSDAANIRCPARLSCRGWVRPVSLAKIIAVALAIVLAAIAFPAAFVWVLFCWVFLVLAANTALRIAALYICAMRRFLKTGEHVQAQPKTPKVLPRVAVIVPLNNEAAVLPALIERLRTLQYPKELLEICIAVEIDDFATRAAIDAIDLPHWINAIDVPPSVLRTKPRAMNYALNFCSGQIVGVYDAEDAPEPDQIDRIVAHFAAAGPDIACVQGYLDFYNARENWLSRCFTIEYAIWFRVILRGMRRLGLPIPLGGTTVFFRRDVLERLGAWDAYNVTEDADLGVRLARAGYTCDFVPTTTFEEANFRTWPWIRQRTRWLKGYAATWLTHMQDPKSLWHDFGPRNFIAFQILFLGSLCNFMLAPVLWSLWWVALGGALPFTAYLPDLAWWMLAIMFLVSETVLLLLGLLATSIRHLRHLIAFLPTMILYWPLGTLAVYRALLQLFVTPFYWDKTEHGVARTYSSPASIFSRVSKALER